MVRVHESSSPSVLCVLAPDLFEEVQLMTLQVWYYLNFRSRP